MRSISFKTRLLLAFWLVLVLAICLPAFHVYNALERQIIKTSTRDALTQLDFINWMARQRSPFESNRELHEWCTSLHDKLGYRVSVITPGGAVIADSAIDYDDVRFMENHSDREEIQKAKITGRASAMRYSSTLQRQLIYVAGQLKIENFEEPMILRLATPMSEVKNRLNTYARQFWGFIALIFGLTMVLSYFLSRRFQQPVYQIMERIKSIGGGDFNHRYITDAGREFYELSGTINETADRISNQMQTITEQNRELEAILENMREGVMLLDRGGRVKSINATLKAIAGTRGSCIGKKPMEIFLDPEIQSACDNIISGAKEHGFTINRDPDNYYEVYLLGIADGGALVVFHDISERRRLEKIRQDFVANVSHELKTPLTSIKGYVETLLSDSFSFPGEARSFLHIILKNTNHMSNMVNDLLMLTRLQEKPPALLLINAADCFYSAWEDCIPMAEEKKILLENKLKPYLPVKADEKALIQVFDNLVRNAIRYSPAGTTITVSAEEKETDIVFAVRDEGPGIPGEQQSRIFERFYRMDRERSRQSGGTGLGLSICRNAIAGMGGRIWVESPPEGASTGSVFLFALPKPDFPDTKEN